MRALGSAMSFDRTAHLLAHHLGDFVPLPSRQLLVEESEGLERHAAGSCCRQHTGEHSHQRKVANCWGGRA